MATTGDPARVVFEPSPAPQEVLEQLDALGIEWRISAEGDLFTKQWTLVGKSFMPPADVPLLRQQGHPDADPLNWVSANLDALRARYGGRWIAVVDRAVAADAATLPKLLGLLQRRGIEKPLVTQVPREEPTWTVTYGCH